MLSLSTPDCPRGAQHLISERPRRLARQKRRGASRSAGNAQSDKAAARGARVFSPSGSLFPPPFPSPPSPLLSLFLLLPSPLLPFPSSFFPFPFLPFFPPPLPPSFPLLPLPPSFFLFPPFPPFLFSFFFFYSKPVCVWRRWKQFIGEPRRASPQRRCGHFLLNHLSVRRKVRSAR